MGCYIRHQRSQAAQQMAYTMEPVPNVSISIELSVWFRVTKPQQEKRKLGSEVKSSYRSAFKSEKTGMKVVKHQNKELERFKKAMQ